MESDAEEAQPAPADISAGSGQRILYVDDEPPLVLLAERVLPRFGYQVIGHTDPLQALQAFRAQPRDFDAVVTDLSMPRMSGFELVRELLATRADVPILMMSGYVRPEDQRVAAELGIRDLILKPNTFEELGQALSVLFNEAPRDKPAP